MKKVLYVICAMLLTGVTAIQFTSCTQEENQVPADEITELKFDIQVINASAPVTKAVKTDWETGDKIYVFFNVSTANSGYNPGYLRDYQYVTLTYNGSTWDGAMGGSNMKVDLLGTAGTMYAVYFPFGNVSTYGASDGDLVGTGFTNSALNKKPVYSFYLTDESGSQYTLTKNQFATLSGTLTMTLPENFVYFYINKTADGKYNQNEKYRLSVQGVKPATVLKWNNTTGLFKKDEFSAGQPMWGFKYGDGIAFAGIIDDSWASPANHEVILFSDGDPAKTKTFKNVSLTSHSSVNIAPPPASTGWKQAMPTPSYTPMTTGETVLNWGDYNLGCGDLNDETYGATFRWGEIVPNGSGTLISLSANSLVGDYAIYDPARAMLGADWRMPTFNEFESLKSSSNSTVGNPVGIVTCGAYSKKCLVLTDKNDADMSIMFLPDGSNSGLYWSSTARSGSTSVEWVYSSCTQLSMSTSCSRDKQGVIRPIYIGN